MTHLETVLILMSLLSHIFLSVYASVNLGFLCKTTQRLISEYLVDSTLDFGSLNRHSRKNQCSLKFFVKQRFNIPELDGVDCNDPELHYLLSLSHLADNSHYLFVALVEDVINRKKPYKTLRGPLLSYLARIFKTLTEEQLRDYYDTEELSVDFYLSQHYHEIGNYKAAFEVIQNNSHEVITWFNENGKNSEIYEMFKENPELVPVLKEAFIPDDDADTLFFAFSDKQPMKICWIFNCVLNDAPEIFYTDLLSQEPILVEMLLKDSNLLYIKVAKYDKPRIYTQFRRLLHEYFEGNDYYERRYCHLINNICFGPENISIGSLNDYENQSIRDLACISLIVGRIDIFNQIYTANEIVFINNIKKIFYPGGLEHLLLASEILKISSEQVRNEILCDPKFLQLAVKYYAIENIKYENNLLILDLVAPEVSLTYGLLPFIRFCSKPMCSFIDGILHFVEIWKNMKIIDEDMLFSFLCDYEKLPVQEKQIETSLEVIKFILSSPILIDKIKQIGIKFIFKNNLVELMDLIQNAEVADIFDFKYIISYDFSRLRSTKKLKLFEELTGKRFASIFLLQDNGLRTESEYFKWRVVLKYWIKGDQKELITKIRSKDIIKMLRIEYYDEMIELLGSS